MPFSENEYYLLRMAEECCEVGQRALKALAFGIDEVQPGQPHDNAARIVDEFHDLFAVAAILQERGVIKDITPSHDRIEAKRAKIEKFMAISVAQGTLVRDT